MTAGGEGLAALARLRRREEEAAGRELGVAADASRACRAGLAAAMAEGFDGPAAALATAARAIARLRAEEDRAVSRVALARERLAVAAGHRRAVELALERRRAEATRAAGRRAEVEADDGAQPANRGRAGLS